MKRILAGIGGGIIAGAAGTAAMNYSMKLERRLRHEQPGGGGGAILKASEKVFGVVPKDEEGKKRFSTIMRWSYGSMWGVCRGLMSGIGLKGLPANIIFLGAVWGTKAKIMPAMEILPPVREWGNRKVAVDILHHGIYAEVTGLISDFLV